MCLGGLGEEAADRLLRGLEKPSLKKYHQSLFWVTIWLLNKHPQRERQCGAAWGWEASHPPFYMSIQRGGPVHHLGRTDGSRAGEKRRRASLTSIPAQRVPPPAAKDTNLPGTNAPARAGGTPLIANTSNSRPGNAEPPGCGVPHPSKALLRSAPYQHSVPHCYCRPSPYKGACLSPAAPVGGQEASSWWRYSRLFRYPARCLPSLARDLSRCPSHTAPAPASQGSWLGIPRKTTGEESKVRAWTVQLSATGACRPGTLLPAGTVFCFCRGGDPNTRWTRDVDLLGGDHLPLSTTCYSVPGTRQRGRHTGVPLPWRRPGLPTCHRGHLLWTTRNFAAPGAGGAPFL